MSSKLDTAVQVLDTEDTIANLQAALAAVHQERDRWELLAREAANTLAARDNDLIEARQTLASLQAELEIVQCDSVSEAKAQPLALLQADRESWLADAKQDEANLEASKADLQQARQALTEKDGAIANRQIELAGVECDSEALLQADRDHWRELCTESQIMLEVSVDGLHQKDEAITQCLAELAAVHQERDRWEAKARETETTLEATRADLQEERDTTATLQGELLKAQAALVRAEELKSTPVDVSFSESQPQTFKPGWVRVTANRAAEIVTSERHCPLDPQPPVTVARLKNMSAKKLEQYNLRRVQKGIQTIYEFYQRTVPISPEK